MPLATVPGRKHLVIKGVLFAALAMATWVLAVMVGTDLTNYEFFDALLVGAGLIFAAGVVLVPWRRTRLLGTGIALGVPLAYVLTVVVMVVGLMLAIDG